MSRLCQQQRTQAASFLMSNSAVASRWMSGGTMPASTTVCNEGASGMQAAEEWAAQLNAA